jgi:hypothetical protein
LYQRKQAEVSNGEQSGKDLLNKTMPGRGKVSISARFLGSDMNFRFKWRKNWGRGQEVVFIIKQSWSKCGLVDHYLSAGPAKWLKEVLIA